jgi:type I restriction enzyme R subunit
MSKPSEHKTVQARILAYAQEIGWRLVSRDEADLRRGKKYGGQPSSSGDYAVPRECPHSLFFEDLLHTKVREFNPRYAEAEGALPGKFPPSPMGYGGTSRHLHTDIYGNPPSPKSYGGTGREFVEHLRNPPSPKGFDRTSLPSRKSYGGTSRGKFFDHEEKRERDLILKTRN